MKKQSVKEIARLFERFPAASRIHDEALAKRRGVPTRIELHVQTAETALLYWTGECTDNSARQPLTDKKGRLGMLSERVYVIGTDGTTLASKAWEKPESAKPLRIKDFFSGKIKIEPGRVGYILTATHHEWFIVDKAQLGQWRRYPGRPVDRELIYTIFAPPPEGFVAMASSVDPLHNVRLTTRLLLDGSYYHEDPFQKIMDELNDLATKFNNFVCRRGLNEKIHQSGRRTICGTFGHVTLMRKIGHKEIILEFAAEDQKKPGVTSTFVAVGNHPASDERFRWRFVDGTLDSIRAMVEHAIGLWQSTPPTDRLGKFYGQI